jgi:CBS domain-containing protein
MKIKDVMTQAVVACHPDDSLADAARIMWDHDSSP